MKRTTIYLPDEMKAELELIASNEGVTEAAVIRNAVAEALARRAATSPTVPLFASRGRPVDWSLRSEDLDGFGES